MDTIVQNMIQGRLDLHVKNYNAERPLLLKAVNKRLEYYIVVKVVKTDIFTGIQLLEAINNRENHLP